MIQSCLPLRLSGRLTTYTDVTAYREKTLAEQGTGWVQELREQLELFTTNQDQDEAIATLARINLITLRLGALDPRWLNYSVQVFMVLWDFDFLKKPSQAKALLRKFRAYESLYDRPTNSENN